MGTTESSSGVEAGVHGAAHNEHLMEMAPVSLTHQHHPVQPVDLLGPAVSIKHGRPDMTALIADAVANAQERAHMARTTRDSASRRTAGLFVCVCGPPGLVKSCKDAVRQAQRSYPGVSIDM